LDGANTLLLVAGVVVTGLAVVLAASYVRRVAVLVALTVAAPLALACHGLPHTEAVARWWWRATAACLAIPVAQSLVLICAVRVFFHHGSDRLLGLGGARLVDLRLTDSKRVGDGIDIFIYEPAGKEAVS
jgi:hypothetical protein